MLVKLQWVTLLLTCRLLPGYVCVCDSDTGELLSQMSTGDFFGEIGILNLDGGVNKYAILLFTS